MFARSFAALSGFAAVVLVGVSMSPWSGAGDITQKDDDPQEIERYCQPTSSSSTQNATCSFDFNMASPNCPTGQVEITNAKCSPKVVTYADDACDGEQGECVPPTAGGGIKKVTTNATPSVTNGCYLSIPANCTCKLAKTGKIDFGRKTCSGA